MPPKQQKIPMTPEEKSFFHRFYEEHKGFLFYIANQYATSSADCEDIVQDAVLRLMGNLSSIRDLNRYKAAKYVALTVRSSYLDLLKKHHTGQEIPLDETVLEAVLEQDPLSGRDPMDSQLEIIHLKQSLTPREWMILEGKYLLGYDQDELAGMIGVSPDSVRMTLSRVRAKARNILLSDQGKERETHG